LSVPPGLFRDVLERAVAYGLALYERERRRADVHERVRCYLLEHPDASANETYRAVGRGCAKSWTLEAVRALRSAGTGNESSAPDRSAQSGGLHPDRRPGEGVS
jgi:hypothetical protein